ncbi:permease [Mycobacterium sp. 852013-51886_SCH5428379]|uniref:permease n=1 Tax=Mycobacterium sp. 852013-51886_SCH5428379 TaxID=1834111 RepID=UPI0008004412|nr:permease [Mycobacterium sp. 852013-51886_SCH5428379]OBB62224.1 permease [Mycobacterium sp. 852013-51886_SCH5428379]
MVTYPAAGSPSRRALVGGVALTAAVLLVGLTWAKWEPYLGKALAAARTHEWTGKDILGVGGVSPGDAPSWSAATSFFHTYVLAIWPALLVALLVSACVQAFVPRTWLPRLLNRRRLLSTAAAGGLASMPTMMCTCCAAPVAVTMRRTGVSRAAVVAYWLGNPLLNPAVLVFLFFVAPWQWSFTRLVVGALAVVGAAFLVGLLTRRHDAAQPPPAVTEMLDSRSAPHRFAIALGRMCLVLLPEYLIIVLMIGACRGWLMQLIQPANHGLLVVLVAAVLGTLLVIPTAGEIPILQGLALLGLSSGVLGALLITLPAVSFPGIAMVVRSLGWKSVGVTAATVVAAGLVGGAMLTVL